jgi:organic radical activating enzyme
VHTFSSTFAPSTSRNQRSKNSEGVLGSTGGNPWEIHIDGYCLQKLGTIENTSGMDIFTYCGKIQTLCDKLSKASMKFEDHIVASFMLAELATDPDYSTYVRITKIDEDLTARTVKADLLLEERRIDAAAAADLSEHGIVLVARGQVKSRLYQNKDDAMSKSGNTGDQKCYKCGK